MLDGKDKAYEPHDIDEIERLKLRVEYWADQACDYEETYTKSELKGWCMDVVFVFIAGTVFGALVVGLVK
jgi:hypothetical protein